MPNEGVRLLGGPQINNNAGENQDNDGANAYSGDKYPHKTPALLGYDIFEVPVAGGIRLAHL